MNLEEYVAELKTNQEREHGGECYLHYYEDGEWTDEASSIECNYGSLSFGGDKHSIYDAYPTGYKLWRMRPLADAPDWVKAERERRRL